MLKKKHAYYTQVQGILYCTKRKFCDICYWTPNWSIISRVEREESWKMKFEKVISLYKKEFLPYYVKTFMKQNVVNTDAIDAFFDSD